MRQIALLPLAFVVVLASPAQAAPSKQEVQTLKDTLKAANKSYVKGDFKDGLDKVNKALADIDKREEEFKDVPEFFKLLVLQGRFLVELDQPKNAEDTFQKALTYAKSKKDQDEIKALITTQKNTQETKLYFHLTNTDTDVKVFLGNNKEPYCTLFKEDVFKENGDSYEKDNKKEDSCANPNKIAHKASTYKSITFRSEGFEEKKFTPENNQKIIINTGDKIYIPGGKDKPEPALTLLEMESTVTYNTVPENASITVDGKPSEKTFKVRGGKHTVVIKAEGYEEKTEPFTAARGEPVNKEIRLQPFVIFVSNAKDTTLASLDNSITFQAGRYVVPETGLPPKMQASAPNYKEKPIDIPSPLVPGSTITIELEMKSAKLTVAGLPENTTGTLILTDAKQQKKELSLPLKEPAEVTEGEYTIQVTATGHQPYDSTHTFQSGTTPVLKLDMVSSKPKNYGFYAGIGVAGAGLIATGAFGGLTLQRRGDVQDAAAKECVLIDRPDLTEIPPERLGSSGCDNTNQLAYHNADVAFNKASLFSTIGLGAVVAGVATIVVFQSVLKPEPPEKSKGQIIGSLLQKLDPTVQASLSGLSIHGSF